MYLCFIGRTVYRGFESDPTSFSDKEYTTGKHKPKASREEDILSREMPQLRIVDDETWFAANSAIDARALKKDRPRGLDHPQHGIPRHARGPLAGVLFCKCGLRFHVGGRHGDAYCCSQKRSGGCWNKATCLREETHREIRDAIVSVLENLGSQIDRLCEEAAKRLDDGGQRKVRIAELREIKGKLEKTRDRLVRAIEIADTPLEILTAKLKACGTKSSHASSITSSVSRSRLHFVLCDSK